MISGVSLNKYQSVSFSGKNVKNKSVQTKGNNEDSFVTTKKNSNKKEKVKNIFVPIIASTGVILVAVGGIEALNKSDPQSKENLSKYFAENPTVSVNALITDEKQLDYIASLYDSQPEIILDSNGVEVVSELPNEFVVPKQFNSLDTRLDRLEEKLESEDITKEEQRITKKNIDAINAHKELQDKYAVAYVEDDGNVYYIMRQDVDSDEFKSLFGVYDGKIYDVNGKQMDEIDFDNRKGRGLGYSNSFNYVPWTLKEGETYVVPKNALYGINCS